MISCLNISRVIDGFNVLNLIIFFYFGYGFENVLLIGKKEKNYWLSFLVWDIDVSSLR